MSDSRPFDVEKVQKKLSNVTSLADLTKSGGVIQDIVKDTVERILQAEQEAHLGYEPNQKRQDGQENCRNGYSKKRLKTSSGDVEISVPRDREGSFEPKIVEKHQSFDPDLEARLTSMYARGMSVRDIRDQLEEFYGTSVSPTLISMITDKVLEGVKDWQSRPLASIYAVLFLDAVHFKVRQDGKVISKAAYTCLGIDLNGEVDVLGIWIAEKEGAHFWQTVLTDLQGRGVEDVLIACIDGLKGFPEAIENIFPRTQVQLCIVHQIRTSLRYLAAKYHKEFARDLKAIYRASSLESAENALEELGSKWKSRARASVETWENNWTNLSTFFQFPHEVRQIIYTTNAVEAVHRQFRKVTKSKGAFPTDDALKKMLYLATIGLKKSLRRKRDWSLMLGQIKVVFEDRIPDYAE